MLLESEGYRVIAHWHGEDAVEVISASHPDLVILDWWLTDMSGADLVRDLKADPRTAQVPLLVCSAAHYDVRTAEEELHRHGVSVVFKPFNVDDLLDQVQRLVG